MYFLQIHKFLKIHYNVFKKSVIISNVLLKTLGIFYKYAHGFLRIYYSVFQKSIL